VEDIQDVLIEEFIALTKAVSWPGAVEFYYWEVLEKKIQPSYIMGPPSEEAMDVLRLLRDGAKIWLMWLNKAWVVVPIDDWRLIADKKTYNQATSEIYRQGGHAT